jgi:hypothetical protein
MRIFWYMVLFVTASTCVVTIFMQLFACGAPATFFKFGAEGCSSKRDIYNANLGFLFSAGSDIAVDVLLLLIPFPLLWRLQVNQRQKCLLATIFLLLLPPITFGILRLIFCNPISETVDVVKFRSITCSGTQLVRYSLSTVVNKQLKQSVTVGLSCLMSQEATD